MRSRVWRRSAPDSPRSAGSRYKPRLFPAAYILRGIRCRWYRRAGGRGDDRHITGLRGGGGRGWNGGVGQADGGILYVEQMGNAVFQGVILFLMTHREIETDGIAIHLYPVGDDVVHRAAELFAGIVGLDLETTHDQPREPVQFTGALQMPEHAIDAVEVFAGVFDEEYL